MTDDRRNLVIAGFMGTGKSMVARGAAARLGRTVVDMDEVIAQRTGMSIPETFRRFGERVFRQHERALCEELEANNPAEEPATKIIQVEAEYERVKAALEAEWQRLYELRLKTDLFFPTGSYKNIGFYPKSTEEE